MTEQERADLLAGDSIILRDKDNRPLSPATLAKNIVGLSDVFTLHEPVEIENENEIEELRSLGLLNQGTLYFIAGDPDEEDEEEPA